MSDAKDAVEDEDTVENDTDCAIVGMACRFPGAANIDAYWQNLCAGLESVVWFSKAELDAAGEDPRTYNDPAYVAARPLLEGIDHFDARLFGMSPRDASVMDPQHRLFLEVTWEALEHAGYGNSRGKSVGVFAASGMNLYMMHNLLSDTSLMNSMGEFLVRHTGNDKDFLATRVSYQMDLRGPSLNVQTACSSTLVTAHLACQSLLSGECDMALAGGSTVLIPQDRGYLYKEGEIMSPDGHCRPFDAASKGTLFGNGVGCVVIKRLADAVADGDNIYAVIKGSAINNDGADKVGYLAPSVSGQASAMAEALAVSGVDPAEIGFIEAHGTGTPVGDPIEVVALTQAYAQASPQTMLLGSVKANIGHLGEAAGVAALIKTALILHHGRVPQLLHFKAPNPQLDLAASPFYVNTECVPWPRSGLRRAAINSLGAGGTNAHMILSQAPTCKSAKASGTSQLLPL
ncbi:MAG: polyketide synthase, partial [Myxococcota bacterium]